MLRTNNKHVYPIIDIMIDKAVDDVRESGEKISCKKGCDHCCHLLVEVAWDEALELAYWIKDQPEPNQSEFVNKVRHNAAEARAVFSQHPAGKRYCQPVTDLEDIPAELFDDYFYNKRRPCPFLQDKSCLVYAYRPSPCRMHLVVSDPVFCSADPQMQDKEIETPELVEEVAEEIEPVLVATSEDPRWGQMGIMVEAALQSIEDNSSN